MAPRHFTRIVAVLFLVVSFNANADFKVLTEGGMTQHAAPPCALWNQDCHGYSSEDELKSYYGRVGLSMPVTGGFSVNLSGVLLGNAKKDSRAGDDEPCALSNGTNSPQVCGSTQRYVAQTSASGMALSLEYSGKWFAVEGGATYLHRRFRIQTQKPDSELIEREDLLNKPDSSLNGFGSFFGARMNVDRTWHVGAYVFTDNIGGGWPSGFSTVYAVSVGKKFRIN